MAQQDPVDRQFIDFPGPPENRNLIVIAHGRGAEYLGAQLGQGLDLLPGDSRLIQSALDYGNIVGAIIELGRLRDRLALHMFPTESVSNANIDDYLTAATHIATHAGSILRDQTADPRRLHSFMGPIRIGVRRMHAAVAEADPAMEDLPLLAATFVNLYDIAYRYATALERSHRIADGFPARIRGARDAINVLCDPDAVNIEAINTALAPGAALLSDLPGHNPADDLVDNEKTHRQAHRDRAAEALKPLADLLRQHLPADVDAATVARYVAEKVHDPFVALHVVRSLCAGTTTDVSFEGTLRVLAATKTAARRQDGLGAEKGTAIAVLGGISVARGSAEVIQAQPHDREPTPTGQRNIYAPDLPYAIDQDVFWLGTTAYRNEFFADLTALTDLLGNRNAIKAAITDTWTHTITPALIAAFVDDVGERLTYAGIAAQQLAGVHLRMADPESDAEQAPGVAFSQLGDEILTAHTVLNALPSRAADLAAMSFDVMGEVPLEAALEGLVKSVRWAALWGGHDPRPEIPFTDTPLAHASAALTADFGWRQEKIIDPHRLGRYFGHVAAVRHRRLPTEREEMGQELWLRRELAQDGANIMLHAGRLHSASVPQVAQRLIGLIDDMETLTVGRLINPEKYEKVVRDDWAAVRSHIDRVHTTDPTSSHWRLGYERRVERALETAHKPWTRKPRRKGFATPVETKHLAGTGEPLALAQTAQVVEQAAVPDQPDEELNNDPDLPKWLRGLPTRVVGSTRTPGTRRSR